MSDRETAYRVPWKWRIGILLCSLLFTIIFLGATTEFREALFVQPVRAAIFQAKSLEAIGPIHDEVRRESWLGNLYAILGLLVALGLPLAAALLTRFVKTRRLLFGGMTAAGLLGGIFLAAIYAAAHRLVLPGGLQHPLYLPALVVSFIFISLFDGLLVGAITQRVGFAPPPPPAARS